MRNLHRRSALISIWLVGVVFGFISAKETVTISEEDHHYLTTDLGVAYSSLLTHYTLVSTCSGDAGGHLQVGYEWQRR